MNHTSITTITASLIPTITTITTSPTPIFTANPIQTVAANPTPIITVRPSPTLTATPSNKQVSPLPVGAIVGVSVGAAAVLCVILVIVAIVVVCSRRLALQKTGSSKSSGPYKLQPLSQSYVRPSAPKITDEVALIPDTQWQSTNKHFTPAVDRATESVEPDGTYSHLADIATHHLTPHPRGGPAGECSGVESGGGATGGAGGLPPVHTYTTAAAVEFDSPVNPTYDTPCFTSTEKNEHMITMANGGLTNNTQPDHTYWDVNSTGSYEDICEGNFVNASGTTNTHSASVLPHSVNGGSAPTSLKGGVKYAVVNLSAKRRSSPAQNDTSTPKFTGDESAKSPGRVDYSNVIIPAKSVGTHRNATGMLHNGREDRTHRSHVTAETQAVYVNMQRWRS